MLGERLTQWVLSLSGFLLVLLNLLAGDVTRMNCYPTVNEQLCIQGLISLSKVKNSSGIQKQVTVSSWRAYPCGIDNGKCCGSDR